MKPALMELRDSIRRRQRGILDIPASVPEYDEGAQDALNVVEKQIKVLWAARTRHPWVNSRGRLKGPLALFRVLESETLRRQALHALSVDELEAELTRRKSHETRRRFHQSLFVIVREVVSLVQAIR